MKCVKRTIFFRNPKVSGAALLKPHYSETARRAKEITTPYILAIQDRTILNFTSHLAKTELGRIGGQGKTSQYGLIQHSTLLVSQSNEPLGLIDLKHFDYDDYDLTRDRHERPIEEKHSFSWIESSRNMRDRLGEITTPVITVADRESDVFEFLYDLTQHKELFVVRAQHNRFTGERYSKKAEKLFALLEQQSDLGAFTTLINDTHTHEIKEITLQLKSLQSVTLPPPHDVSKEKYHAIPISVVMAYNKDYCWILLTNLPSETIEQVKEIVTIYKFRWHIEDYHKILKTGYQIDEVYLHSSRQAIISALSLISLSACRLYWVIYVGRVDPACKADELFNEYEWKAPYIYLKDPLPVEAPPLAELIVQIARMGGYKLQKKSLPPGIKSMWLGLQALGVAAEMYKNILSTKT